jgi:glutamate formiminotransferase
MKIPILIESVPNFSEGQNADIIASIASAIRSVSQVKLIHIDSGFDANRTVYTLIGPPEFVTEALYRAIRVSSEKIDMRTQNGKHPRIGACDVCPLIPIKGIGIEDLKPYALELAHRIGNDFQLPVFLYESSAIHSYRKNLADIRKGEYEGLAEKMKADAWKSDNHQPFNSKTGATVLGVRSLLIAYNVNLDTKDVTIAKDIAKKMRYSSGGMHKGLKAIGWMMDMYNCAQVSFNITDTEIVSIAEVFEEVKKIAATYDIKVNSSELIGLMSENNLKFALSYFDYKPGLEGENALIEKLGLNFVDGFNWNERIIERLM